ncbi:MAG: hypothetical protein KF802_01175 [Bdellovibrionaceae bacterium]|nr:hypothetical protein [Pseudobdellovibrionaceae bacterium]
MKAIAVHLKNKYPGGKVESSENHIDAYDAAGDLRVSVRKNGAGQRVDAQHETGALDQLCLSPIPKNARVYKLFADGRVGLSEEAAERKIAAGQLAVAGKVLSLEDYKKAGANIDEAGNVIIPAPAARKERQASSPDKKDQSQQ